MSAFKHSNLNLPSHLSNTLKFQIHFHYFEKPFCFSQCYKIAQCLANGTRCRRAQIYKISPFHFFLSPSSYKTIQQSVLLLHYQSLACRTSLNNNANICSAILHLADWFPLLENPFQYQEAVITCDRSSYIQNLLRTTLIQLSPFQIHVYNCTLRSMKGWTFIQVESNLEHPNLLQNVQICIHTEIETFTGSIPQIQRKESVH